MDKGKVILGSIGSIGSMLTAFMAYKLPGVGIKSFGLFLMGIVFVLALKTLFEGGFPVKSVSINDFID